MSNPVDQIYDGYSGRRGHRLRDLRKLVLSVARDTPGVGRIEECLKWGQPSFFTKAPKSGSTIRLDAVRDSDTEYALYFICTTNLVSRFREIYPDTFVYSANRAIILDADQPIARDELRHCVAMALTYHLT